MDQFTYVKRGYDPEEVDKYISTLEQVIKSYKDKDNAIKNAIISAQVAADNVVRNAQMHADAYKVQIGEQLVDIRATLDRQRMSLQAFQESYANIVRRCIQELEQSGMADLFLRLEEMEKAISDLQGLEAVSGVSGAISGPTVDHGYHEPRDSRDYHREIQDPHNDNRPGLRDIGYEQPRDYNRDQRNSPHGPAQESLFDTERDMRPQARDARESVYSQDNIRENVRDEHRDIPRSRDPHHTSPYDDHDRTSDYESSHGYNPRENMYQPEPVHNERDMRHHSRDMAPHHTGYDQPQRDPWDTRDQNRDQIRDQGRDQIRDQARDQIRDYAPEPSRDVMREPSRDMRREPTRDTRRDVRDPGRGRDVRDQGRDMMRPPENQMRQDPRDQMRDMGRPPYMPEADNYDNNGSNENLLPPVASLM